MHSVYVKELGLSSPLTAEVQFVDCVIGALFSVGRKIQSRRRQLQLHQLKRLGGGQPPSFPWHARPQSHEIQDFLLKFLLIFHQSGFLQRIL